MIDLRAVLDVALAVIAVVALVLDLGGEKHRAHGGSFWQRLTHPGRAQVALGAMVFIVLAGMEYIDLRERITQADEKRAAAITQRSRADTDVAEKGIAILEKTTEIPDHDPDHDAG